MSQCPTLLPIIVTAAALLLCAASGVSSSGTAAGASKAAPLRGVGSIAIGEAPSRPWFCRGLDCPAYEVVETKGDLQLRRYRRSDYLVTKVEADDVLQAQIVATERLASYFVGGNEDSRLFKPTVPLNSVLLTADRQSETVKGKFFFGSYLPDQLQGGKAPRPKNREVRIASIGRRAVWVNTFNSPLLTESEIIQRGWHLIKDLEDMGRKVDSRFFVFSLYEVPVPFLPHHYEIAVSEKCKRDDKNSSGGAEKFSVKSGLPIGRHGEVSGLGGWDDDYPFALESEDDVGGEECDDIYPTTTAL